MLYQAFKLETNRDFPRYKEETELLNVTCLGPVTRRGPELVCRCTTDQVQAHVCAQDHTSSQHFAWDLGLEQRGRPTQFRR